MSVSVLGISCKRDHTVWSCAPGFSALTEMFLSFLQDAALSIVKYPPHGTPKPPRVTCLSPEEHLHCSGVAAVTGRAAAVDLPGQSLLPRENPSSCHMGSGWQWNS